MKTMLSNSIGKTQYFHVCGANVVGENTCFFIYQYVDKSPKEFCMKNLFKLFGIIALVAVIGFSMSGCEETETAPTPGTVTYTGTADGVTYTLKITENIARYTAQIGDTYELTVGTKKSTGTVEGVTGGTLTLKPSNGAAFTATVNSSGITGMTGTITFDDGTSQPVPTVITPPAPPVTGDRPVKDRWGIWIDKGTTVTLDYSVDDDEVCTITVRGAAVPNSEDGWKARAYYDAYYVYPAKAGKSFVYTFDAWTESGTRNLGFQYCNDGVANIYKGQTILITSTRKTYTIYGDNLSNNAGNNLEFQCANQLGTFYVKILEIKEVIPLPPVTGDNPFKGTWKGTMFQITLTLKFGDTSFEFSGVFNEDDGVWYSEYKGTYTYTSNTATVKYTEAKNKKDNGEWKSNPDVVGISQTLTLSNGELIFNLGKGESGEDDIMILTKIN